MKLTETKLRQIIREEIRTVKDMGGPAIKFDMSLIDASESEFQASVSESLRTWGFESVSNLVVESDDMYVFFDASVRQSELRATLLDDILDSYQISPRAYQMSADV